MGAPLPLEYGEDGAGQVDVSPVQRFVKRNAGEGDIECAYELGSRASSRVPKPCAARGPLDLNWPVTFAPRAPSVVAVFLSLLA